MKKIVLTIIAVLSMTMTYAETTKNTEKSVYAMKVNDHALARSLALTEYQQYAVSEIMTRFKWDMQRVAKSNDADRQKKLRKAVSRNLTSLSKVLTPEQYRKYNVLINATFVNRGIIHMM